MKTWSVEEGCAGLKSQSTRQCPLTVNDSVSRLPLPCQSRVTTQAVPASAGAASATSAGADADGATVADPLAAVFVAAETRFSMPITTTRPAMRTATLIRASCAFHQRTTCGHGLVASQRSRSFARSAPRAAGRRALALVMVIVLLGQAPCGC